MILCLTGMHRSGTSLVASWLEQRGIPMSGDKAIGADVGNESGHYEDRLFNRFTSAAIERAVPGSAGWKLPSPNAPRVRFDRHEIRRLSGHARMRRRAASPWGWKDPRACVCLESFLVMFPTLRVLGLWRPAELVVDSLLRRSERAMDRPDLVISEEEAVMTWLGYNEALLRSARRHHRRVTIVSLEDLLELSEVKADGLVARFGLGSGPPLRSVFDPDRLRGSEVGATRGSAALAARATEVDEMTQALGHASWR